MAFPLPQRAAAAGRLTVVVAIWQENSAALTHILYTISTRSSAQMDDSDYLCRRNSLQKCKCFSVRKSQLASMQQEQISGVRMHGGQATKVTQA